MTDTEKITRVKTLLMNDAEATDDIVSQYLSIAKDTVLLYEYPFGIPDDVTDVEGRYEGVECELAARYFARRGGLGETAHNENGINRTYGSEDDSDLLRRITRKAKVI